MPVTDTGTWNNLVSAPITLAALGSTRASFTQILMLVASVTPGGGTIASYTTLDEVIADTANLSAVAISMATAIFEQGTYQAAGVSKLYIQGVDTGGGQTHVQALAAAIASGADIFCIVADSRTPATQILIATAVETYAASGAYYLFITQDDDADWLTTGIPSAWSAVEDYEFTAIVYHDDNANDSAATRADCALAGNRIAWDPDVQSVAWNCNLAGVDALTTDLTDTQRGFVDDMANAVMPFFDATSWLHPGQNLNGRQLEHIVTAAWIRRRLMEAGGNALVAASARGTKIAVDPEGQGLLKAAFEAVAILAVSARHLTTTDPTKPPYRVKALAITDADITAGQLRFTFEGQFATGVRKLSIPVNLSALALTG